MSFLLDTNVVSELRKPAGRADAGVRRWASARPPGLLHLSVVTVMEIEIGVRLVERRDEAAGAVLRAWLTSGVLAAFDRRILPVDLRTARRAARMHVPDPRPERDTLIAATAAVHGYTVATRNVGDFAGLGVDVVNPWDEA